MRPTTICLASAVLAATLGAACAEVRTFSRVVYEDPTLFVRLDSPLSNGLTPAYPNTHPVKFGEQDLSLILRTIKVQKEVSFLSYYVLRHDPKTERAFTDHEITSLTPYLATALAKAFPEETVTFLVERGRGGGISEITSGSMFVRNKHLYLVLSNFRVPVTTKHKMERARKAPLVSLGEPDFRFVAGPQQTILTAKEANVPGVSSSPALRISFTHLLAESREPSRLLPVSPAREPAPSLSSAEEKLRRLKAWYGQGLISEEEYTRKRAEILDSL